MKSKGLLKSNTQSFIKYCQLSEFVNVKQACIDLSIKQRRLNDILIVLEGVNMVRRVKEGRFKVLGYDNLTVDRFSKLDVCASYVPLSLLARVVFRYLVDCGGKTTPKAATIMKRLRISEDQWLKANRRIYDILNIFDGAGIVEYYLRPLHPPPPPPSTFSPPWWWLPIEQEEE